MADQVRGLLSPWLRTRRICAVRAHVRGRVLDFGCGVGALARLVPSDRYLGIDADEESLATARQLHPGYRFADRLDAADPASFDTVVALAVIEHVEDPPGLLRDLCAALRPGGRILLTTPHRACAWMHGVGARAGLFSREAHDEHTTLFDEAGLRRLVAAAGMQLLGYRRFLLGANQVVVAARPPGGTG